MKHGYFLLEFFISSFILLFSFGKLFIKTNSSRLITESIKALEIKTSILFNWDFANNTILSCFFFFFLVIDLYYFSPVVIAQIFNPTPELVIPIEILIKDANAEIEISSSNCRS